MKHVHAELIKAWADGAQGSGGTRMKRFAFYVQHPYSGYRWHIATGNNKSEAAEKVWRRIGGNVFGFGLIRTEELA